MVSAASFSPPRAHALHLSTEFPGPDVLFTPRKPCHLDHTLRYLGITAFRGRPAAPYTPHLACAGGWPPRNAVPFPGDPTALLRMIGAADQPPASHDVADKKDEFHER
ncbi:MAG: hypothetical protein ACJA0F_000994 [Dinoroseobacter sp.]|jgi:hypothetical protein